MSKTNIKNLRHANLIDRGEVYAHYVAKYFNLFLNRFKFEGDITDREVAFIMRQFWSVGTVACYKMEGTEGSVEYPRGKPIFAPYAVNSFDLYRYPIDITLVALNNAATFLPTRPLRVDEEACIGYIQRNKEPVCRVVEYYANRLATAEMVLQINLLAQKYPWLIGTSPEGADKARQLGELLLQDKPALFVELEEIDKAKALVSGAPYIIDKLKNYIITVENELREYLGLMNLGVNEKKEHLLDSEVESNNEVTRASGDVFLDCMVEFFDRVGEYLGIDIRVSLNQPEEPQPQENQEEQEEQEGEEDA